jgi:ssDNA-binding Zn-finger/Zn-ribbon topoisomerase 1
MDHVEATHDAHARDLHAMRRERARARTVIATDLKCADCGAALVYTERGKFGPWYACERWPECRGSHGAHPDGTPLGTPANAALRAARIRAHAAFDPLWHPGSHAKRGRRRRAAYDALRAHLGLSETDGHIGKFSTEQCEQVVAFANARREKLAAEREIPRLHARSDEQDGRV